MKLLVQINVAFGVLLVLVLSVTAVIFHYVLLDHFIKAQKKDMQQMSSTISMKMQALPLSEAASAAVPAVSETPVLASSLLATPIAVSPLLGIDAIITDNQANVVYSTLPGASAQISVARIEEAGVSKLQMLREGKDDRYLVATNDLSDGTLTLFMPMSKIKAIEQAVLGRLLVVLCIGGILVFLLSLIITRRLIKPLMKLRGELRKVENRRFSEVKLVEAGGEIGDVAQTVYEMAEELETYSRIQKQFIQNASHELKTPLMSISGYAEGIRDGIFEGESVRKGLDIIISESGRLKNIVTEMTLLAKLEGEEHIFKLAEVDIVELIEETIERINPLLVQKGLTIETAIAGELADALVVRADRDKLLQALLNVVSNATRYARHRILIRAGMGKNQIELSVTDDGGGIPDDLLPQLFHRFVKGKEGETGLGLAISRAIVERCGGTISARNDEAGGADISMRFPAAA
ncbi:HAMP domain-containing histidine kinase [Paenibacillus mesophilus]|uniref:sensor histidine kinase n=1 Tax=Paenibacillus mesophilus TaxID=2582849 RepID=UPI00110D9E28|nr:HAMP domain-containing sensor histidine kinase [Paenibacillus mesophilus]TMV46456.1 HAMP domain-containing histidine kinase [Paenibacillus mesophilus]